MGFIVSVRPLRQGGTRLSTPGRECSGYFSLERKSSSFGLVLISDTGGVQLLGPLYEPRLIKAGIEGMILLGFEVTAGAAVVQEWLVGRSNVSFRPNGWSIITNPEDNAPHALCGKEYPASKNTLGTKNSRIKNLLR